jgi:hypothetical protein
MHQQRTQTHAEREKTAGLFAEWNDALIPLFQMMPTPGAGRSVEPGNGWRGIPLPDNHPVRPVGVIAQHRTSSTPHISH